MDKSRPIDECQLDGIPRTRLDAAGWEVRCSIMECDTLLGRASWLDIQVAMMLNQDDSINIREFESQLPPIHLRAFRMNVLFAPGWRFDEATGAWSSGAADLPTKGARATSSQWSGRLIDGRFWSVELALEATPPARAYCPTCGLLQVVDRVRRKGPPGQITDELMAQIKNLRGAPAFRGKASAA